MDGFAATLIVVALFLLRFMIPLMATFAFGYAMNRFMNRWQVEM